jgi:hypothetical protein
VSHGVRSRKGELMTGVQYADAEVAGFGSSGEILGEPFSLEPRGIRPHRGAVSNGRGQSSTPNSTNLYFPSTLPK